MFGKKNKLTIDQTKINLAPKDPFYESMLGKLTTWALTIGRYLVIFTELVVIVSFLSRFNLDRQVTDLNQQILQKQRVIESYGDLEQNVRDVQKKIETYNQLKAQRPLKEVFDALSGITPADVQYRELTIQGDTVLINAHANSLEALNRFILNIQASTYFVNVVSENISNKDSSTQGFDFQISALIASEKTKAKPTTRPRPNVSPVESE
jgi:Tfp pilus assembly protein PilN